jgi:hypothetical protein
MKKILPLAFAAIGFAVAANAQSIKANDAKNYVGKKVTVCDSVMGGKHFNSPASELTLLNVGGKHPNAPFTIAIFGPALQKFTYKPEVFLVNKRVCFTGEVKLFKEKPEMEISEPTQIEVSK